MASCVRATLENVQFAVLCMFEAGAVHLIPRFFYKAVFPLYFQLRGQIGANKADLPLKIRKISFSRILRRGIRSIFFKMTIFLNLRRLFHFNAFRPTGAFRRNMAGLDAHNFGEIITCS